MWRHCFGGGAMKGQVNVWVKGYNLDQLLNKMYAGGILCFSVERNQVNEMQFDIRAKDLKKLKPIIKNYEYKLRPKGMANIKQFALKNLACLIMVPIGFALFFISSRYIWDIKIYGGDDALQSQALQILSDNDISVRKLNSCTTEEVEQILLNQLPNIAQVSCIKRGNTIVINISEKLVYTPETFQPIVAKYDGTITSFSLISGTMAVNIGDFVAKGDILVYPFTLDKSGEQVSVQPIAEVKAKAFIVGTSNLTSSELVLQRTGRECTISSISIFNRNLFSKNMQKPFDIYETNVYNENVSSVLPIVRTTTTYYELDYMLVSHDLVAEQSQVETLSRDNAYQMLPSNCDIVDENISSVIVQDCLYCTTTLTVLTVIS